MVNILYATDYEIKKFHFINNKYLYLLKLNSQLWATVINDNDDFTTLDAMVHLTWLDALHTYNEWKSNLLNETK